MVDLRDYLIILRKNVIVIIALTLVGVLGGAISVLRATPTYQSRTQLFVSTTDAADSITQLLASGTLAAQRVTSYAQIVTSPLVAQAVVKKLQLKTSAESVASEIAADNPLNTVLIDVTVTDPSPGRAYAIAQAIGQVFGSTVAEFESTGRSSPAPVKVSVSRPATYSAVAVSPNRKLGIALGSILGLIAALGAIAVREVLDTTLKRPDDLYHRFNLPLLGTIPVESTSPLMSAASPSTAAEAFRQLRTNLQFVHAESTPHAIVFTSAVAGEGKTTTVANLGLTLAKTGLRVLLIDADLRRPKLAEILGIESSTGLTDVLVGRYDLADVTQHSIGAATLSALPTGRIPPNPSELLGSARMSRLIERCGNSYDYVLIDAPPLLPVTDAAVLSAYADGAVLIVRFGKTKRAQLTGAINGLASVEATTIGGVLNMVPRRASRLEGYNYGYDYAPEASSSKERTLPQSKPRAVRKARGDSAEKTAMSRGQSKSAG